MYLNSKKLGSVLIATLMGTAAMAGTQLKLNAGVVATKGLQQKLMQQQVFAQSTSTNKTWIVQFKNAVTEGDKKSLQAAGGVVLGYLPDDALVVRANQVLIQKLQQHSGIEAVVPYLPEFKVAKNLPTLSVFNSQVSDVLVVKAFTEADVKSVVEYVNAKQNARVLFAAGKTIVVQSGLGLARALSNLDSVEHVQLDPQMKPMHMTFADEADVIVAPVGAGDYSDLKGDESGTKVMNFDAAWAQGLTGAGQIASMADTGLDRGSLTSIHSDFAGQIKSGYAVGLFGKSWEDPMGHGTHVAGSIIGNGNTSHGLIKGGAPAAALVAESMWSPMLNNLSVPNKLGDMFQKAYNDGARVHSNSWGGARSFGSYDNYAIQVDEWMWNNPEMLILFAAGNSGIDKDKDGRIDANSMASPGTAKNVLTVGASENVTTSGGIQVPISKLRVAKDNWGAEPIYSSMISDNANGISMFSSRGPTSDGRIKPDIVAPGTNILSTRSHHKDAQELWGAYNSEYVWSGGTSMATPLTAGAVTVLRQYLVEKRGIQNPSAALMKAYMLHKAVDIFPGQYGEVGAARGQEILTRRPNSDEGYGRVDVARLVDSAAASMIVDNKVGVGQGEVLNYSFRSNGGPVLVNLVWTDAPGSANAAKALVNDLDLVLVGPQGIVKDVQDRVNNHEIIELANLPAGDYQIQVKGFKVPQGKAGKQAFALVYSF